jgi:sugar lactone lactonase YvrE/thioredoxin-related protein
MIFQPRRSHPYVTPSRRNRPSRPGPQSLAVISILLAFAVLLSGCVSTGDAEGEDTSAARTSEEPGRTSGSAPDSDSDTSSDPDDGRFAAIPFPERAEWVNLDEPLTMEGLKGRYVLLDFWTYGCINCYHMIPNLNALHERYDSRLIVVGVHSAKFTEEQDTRNIREAIERYDIRYPVINDREMELWRQYQVPGWPTIVLIDPDGYVVGGSTGEWEFERLAGLLDMTIDADPDAAPQELPQLSQAAVTARPATRLSFPQGLTYDSATDSLYVSDTGNNRLLQVDPETGTVTASWGTGAAGLRDGDAASAQFRSPRGLTVHDGTLYLADTGNHAIRIIELASQSVSTAVQGGIGPADEIRSPWDIASDGERLYFANAGQHQIWTLDPETDEAAAYSGSGLEGLFDGTAGAAQFAQPSGLSWSDGILYVADPESSAVRAVDTRDDGSVTTLAGEGLFEFGYQDGRTENARLMHVGDVEYTSAGIILADTYNNSLRLISDGVVRTIAQNLNEPKALATDGERVWIADTNNHRILQTDLSRIASGSDRLDSVSIRPGSGGADAGEERTPLSFRQNLTTGSLRLDIQLPAEHKLNEESPNSLVFRSPGGEELLLTVDSEGTQQQTVTVPWQRLTEAGILDPDAGRQSVTVESWLYYCLQENEEICRFFSSEVQVLLEDSPDASSDATVSVVVE